MHSATFVLFLLAVVSSVQENEAKCSKIYEKGVSDTQKTAIVNRHNEIRLMVATGILSPKAANMKRISWDNSLATQAQIIAETCVFAHVKVNDSRFAVGQNLYWSAFTVFVKGADWTAALNSWFNEYYTYSFGTSQYNHYTQLVWANTHLVGCGYIMYSNRPYWYEKLYVCNYGPAGNYIGQTPYEVGAGCENLC